MKRTFKEKLNFAKTTYAVVKFIEDRNKLFESIPESWFVDEEKTSCFWPPKSGRSVTLRAIDQDLPDWDWEVYECIMVSLGHVSYSIAASIVREKCSQPYNTSSADEHIEAAKFKRAHPGLVLHEGKQNIENVFEASAAKKEKGSQHSKPKKPEQKIGGGKKIVSPESPLLASESSVIVNGGFDNCKESHQNAQLSQNHVFRHSGSTNAQQNGSNESGENKLSVLANQENPRTEMTSKVDQYNRLRQEFLSRRKRKSGDTARLKNSSTIRPRRPSCNSIHSTSNRSGSRSTRRSGSRSTRHSVSRSTQRSDSRSTRRSGSRSTRRSGSRSSRSSVSRSTQRSGNRSIRRSDSRSSQRSGSRSSRRSGNRSTRRSGSRTILRSGSRSTQRSGSHLTRRSGTGSRSSFRSGRTSIGSLGRPSNNNLSPRSGRSSRSLSTSCNHASQCSGHDVSNSQASVRAGGRESSRAELFMGRAHRQSVQSDLPSQHSPPDRSIQGLENYSSAQENDRLKTLMKRFNDMSNLLNKMERRNKETDRRLNRMEVTTNKTFVLVGDLVNGHNARMSLGHVSNSREVRLPRGYRMPKLPITKTEELSILKRDLRNKHFLSFLVNDQKQYCTPSQQATDNVVMIAFLKRFVSVGVRAKLVLKDLKGKHGKTLYHDFREVYDFIVEVFKAGYEVRNQIRTNKEAQSVLRVVWGRSKQMLIEGKNAKK